MRPEHNLHVLVVQTHPLRERQLPDLLYRLEPLAVSLELVCQAGRLGGEFSCHKPDSSRELEKIYDWFLEILGKAHLVPLKTRHGGEVRTLTREIFMGLD